MSKVPFRVVVQGHYVETWEVDAHDVQDAIRRVQWAEGSWMGAEWAGQPRYSARSAQAVDANVTPGGHGKKGLGDG